MNIDFHRAKLKMFKKDGLNFSKKNYRNTISTEFHHICYYILFNLASNTTISMHFLRLWFLSSVILNVVLIIVSDRNFILILMEQFIKQYLKTQCCILKETE